MGNVTLTKILFATLIVTFVAATLFNSYLSFASANGANIEEPYRTAFSKISQEYASSQNIGDAVKDEGLVKNIFNFGSAIITGTMNVFVVGLQAMGSFFEMIPIIGNILSAITLGFPALSGLIGLLILIVGIYIAMRYIQSVSNKQDLP
jgi:hypothetical protein